MSTLLFVEILRERGIQAQWFDARKVLRTNDRFGRAEPDIAAVAELTQQQLAPRPAEGPGGDPRALSAAKRKAAPPPSAAAAAIIPPLCSAKR